MSKEELKRIDLKVTVNCCEGCKRKVLKALSIKGVLKTEIHPDLPKITVIGDVDVHILIRRLGKTGKVAELWPTDAKSEKPAQITESITTDIDKSNIKKAKEGKRKKKEAPNSYDSRSSNKVEIVENEKGNTNVDRNTNIEATDLNEYEYQTVVTTIPQVNPNVTPPDHCRVHYQMDPNPIPNPNYSVPPPCCNQHQHHYGMPVLQYSQYPPPVQPQQQHQQHHYEVPARYGQYPAPPVEPQQQQHYKVPVDQFCQYPVPVQLQQQQQYQHHYMMPVQYHQYPPPVQLQQQPAGFMDYFNDDNTVGCCVM